MNPDSGKPLQLVAHRLADGGAIPNHPRWPLLHYPNAVALDAADPVQAGNKTATPATSREAATTDRRNFRREFVIEGASGKGRSPHSMGLGRRHQGCLDAWWGKPM